MFEILDYYNFLGIILEISGFILLLTQIREWIGTNTRKYELVSFRINDQIQPIVGNDEDNDEDEEFSGTRKIKNNLKIIGIVMVIIGLFFQLMSSVKIVT